MSYFYNLRIAAKLIIAFLVMSSITAGVGYLGLSRMSTINEMANDLYQRELMGVSFVKEANIQLISIGRAERNILLATNEGQRQQAKAEWDRRKTALLTSLDKARDKFVTDGGRQLLADVDRAWQDYDRVHSEIVDMAMEEEFQEERPSIELAMTSGRQTADAIDNLMTELAERKEGDAKRASEVTDEVYASSQTFMFAAIGLSLLFGVGVGVSISRIIANPIRQLVDSALRIARGDLDGQIEIHTKEELGELADAFRRMVESQKQLSDAANCIAAGNMNVEVAPRSERDVLGHAFVQLRESIRSLTDETDAMVSAAKEGNLRHRGKSDRFQGAYRELVEGINETLDAVIQPINEAADVLSGVAQRDLARRMTGNYLGDHAQIKQALNEALDNLEDALYQASMGAEQVSAAATQISNGSQQLAQCASEQASSLEEISSSLEEMTSMTSQMAENSNQGKLLANQAQSSAERGNEAMTRMAGAINKIKESSDDTAKIVKTIDEIAFQTNLLALNAAVEVARAGEAGKGFAVVAEEVRNLAQRSAEAAKTTARLIEESVQNAEGGVQISQDVAQVLAEITEGSCKVRDLVAEIAAASKEQAKGIQQVNAAVTLLDKVTQQNAANSEESASAAEELNSQSVSLSQTVAQFRLSRAGNSQGMRPAPVAPVPSKARNGQSVGRGDTKQARRRELVGATAGANGHGNGRFGAEALLPLDDDDFKDF